MYMPAGKLVDDTLNALTGDDELQQVNTLKRFANRVRQKQRPRHPTDLEFEVSMKYLFN